jgi:hypothetical protein
VAQAFSFLAAGFETSGTTLSYALYELALHPDVQNRLREEIKQVLDKHQGELTYEGMNEMSYLDMVIKGMLTEAGYILWIVIFWIVMYLTDKDRGEMFLQNVGKYKISRYNPGDNILVNHKHHTGTILCKILGSHNGEDGGTVILVCDTV